MNAVHSRESGVCWIEDHRDGNLLQSIRIIKSVCVAPSNGFAGDWVNPGSLPGLLPAALLVIFEYSSLSAKVLFRFPASPL